MKRLRQYLPVTKVDLMRHKRDGWIRRIDVASAIFKCILQDRLKYIQGDYPVAWAHWQRLAGAMRHARYAGPCEFEVKLPSRVHLGPIEGFLTARNSTAISPKKASSIPLALQL